MKASQHSHLKHAAMTIAAGTKLGRYEIRSQLGVGGMGEVYLAQDTKLDRKVALKILPADVAADRNRMSRFVQEAKAASALNHPNIITIHEIDETDSGHFIATEFIDGVTLRQSMKNAPMKLTEVLDAAIQTASALSAAHTAGIVHRDIKPENVMVRKDGIVKVLDFGLAKLSERLPPDSVDTEAPTSLKTNPGTVIGTAVYMSPEQARGIEVDVRTDIFSLGVLIYEMVAGHLPFEGSNTNEILASILSDKEPSPLARYAREVPAELERIVSKALRKNRDERYQTIKDLVLDLKRLRQELEFSAELERSGAAGVFGVQRSSDKVSEPTATDRGPARQNILTSRRALIIAAPVALLIVTALVYAMFFRRASVPVASDVKSLAVLPFKNVGSDAQDDYLSDGIADELITKLTKLKTIRVVSLSVAMRFKGSAKDAVQIGRELGVDAVLDGSVRKAGDHFRVNVHLINVKDGFEIWADDGFESNIQNLLDAERQLAEAVAVKLKGELTPQDRTLVARNNTANADAYELLLRGKEHLRKDERETARQMFERAIQLDPNFADAYAWLAFALGKQFQQGEGERRDLDAAFINANKALAIDPNSVVARRVLITFYRHVSKAEEGLKQAKLALAIDPNDYDTIAGAAWAYFEVGMVDRSIQFYQKAIAMDPNDSFVRARLARSYLYSGDYQKGLDVLAPLLARQQGGEWVATLLYDSLGQLDKAIEVGARTNREALVERLDYGRVFSHAGRLNHARDVWREAAQTGEAKVTAIENVRTRIWLGHLYERLGERDKALDQTKQALAFEPDNAWVLYQAGEINALLGRDRAAVEYFKQAVEHGFRQLQYFDFFTDHLLSDHRLRDDLEFQAVRNDLQRRVNDLRAQY